MINYFYHLFLLFHFSLIIINKKKVSWTLRAIRLYIDERPSFRYRFNTSRTSSRSITISQFFRSKFNESPRRTLERTARCEWQIGSATSAAASKASYPTMQRRASSSPHPQACGRPGSPRGSSVATTTWQRRGYKNGSAVGSARKARRQRALASARAPASQSPR